MEAARKIGFFGNCCVRNVRYEAESRRFKVNDRLDFDEIASGAGLCVTDFSKFGCTVTKAEKYIEKMFPRIDGDLVFMDFGRYDSDFDWMCSKCDEQWSQASEPKVCPNCGAIVLNLAGRDWD